MVSTLDLSRDEAPVGMWVGVGSCQCSGSFKG